MPLRTADRQYPIGARYDAPVTEPFRLIVGLSGASGVIYGIRLLEVLAEEPNVETHLVASPAARQTIQLETDRDPDEVEALATVRYRVVNTLGRPVTAHAVMNTAPAAANKWIEKQECFCFTEQTLAAGLASAAEFVLALLAIVKFLTR